MTAPKNEAIETLTDDEAGALRVLTRCPGWGSQREVEALAKALRIIDAQAADIKALREAVQLAVHMLDEDFPLTAGALREVLRGK